MKSLFFIFYLKEVDIGFIYLKGENYEKTAVIFGFEQNKRS